MLAFTLVLFSCFIVIFVYDIRHTIIPDEMTIGVGVLAMLFLGYTYALTGDGAMILAHLGGGAAAAFFFWSLWYLSKGRWIGLGDAKLALPLGAIVGGTAAFSMVVFSFWIGAVVSLLILGLQRILEKGTTKLFFWSVPLTMKSEVPFAPFLLASFLLTYIFHADTFSIIERVFPW
jgi:prepilin signal peptidase PulO-like enzyme (type II secretory pathway)